jgi:hypothetical protein
MNSYIIANYRSSAVVMLEIQYSKIMLKTRSKDRFIVLKQVLTQGYVSDFFALL